MQLKTHSKVGARKSRVSYETVRKVKVAAVRAVPTSIPTRKILSSLICCLVLICYCNKSQGDGSPRGIRTLTVQILSLLPLPVGLSDPMQ